MRKENAHTYYGMDLDIEEKILFNGISVIWQKGYEHSSIQEIMAASDLPKGSFYNHFKSKSDFALKALNLYIKIVVSLDGHEKDQKIRLINLFQKYIEYFSSYEFTKECFVSVLALDIYNQSEKFRQKLNEAFTKRDEALVEAFSILRKENRLNSDLEIDELVIIVDAIVRGSMTKAKLLKDSKPLLNFMKFLQEDLIADKPS
ncbi:TetR/AcrR family transcriptional regulator [Aureivirga sp. CE67]|uniref:TetR/AcrR family transcriptional regulator n=1 Tax=Aureivirga sp. CE67 TaxID=1788983 RepID=UPI0018C97B62|nr:TetR/AcrR family transcriptional regulator [Aureivirga sp. CE67]